MPFCHEITKQYGIDPQPPDRVPGQPVRPVEGPGRRDRGVPHRARAGPDAQLVLAGSMATDDPEGFHVWEQTEEARAGDRDIHLLSNLHQVGTVQINAFQRIADVVVQKSLREGFGLTVSEALWKGRPVVGGRAGGITLQIRDGFDGYLVDSVEECAQRTIDLLADPGGRRRDGRAGPRARARELPLDPRARGLARAVRRRSREPRRRDRRLATAGRTGSSRDDDGGVRRPPAAPAGVASALGRS